MTTRFGALFSVFVCLAVAAAANAQSPVPEAPVARAAAAIEQGRFDDALRLLESAPLSDVAEARYMLAELYVRGRGVPQDFGVALEYYRQAARLGSVAAENALGRAYAEGQAVQQDPQLAFDYLRAAARSGVPDYQSDLARALEAGLGGEPRPAEAASWYQRAADQGDLNAITSLGVLYLEGRGVERDADRAIELFTRASEGGDPRAQNNLGLIYVRGEDVERDYDRAFELFSAAAEKGQREALTNLSVMYASGFGVAVDEAESLRLLEQARQARGLSLAAILGAIGFPYDPRLVIPDWDVMPDPSEERAALAGDPIALYWTGVRYVEGAGVRQDVQLGMSRLEQSARGGMGSARFLLGLMFANGRGVPQDYVNAYVWTSLAALAAFPMAAELRDAIAAEMSPEQLAGAQQRVAQESSLRP